MAVMAVYLAEQPVRQVSLIDCWCGPTGAKRCRSHNKRRCATALKCSSSFTISSAPAEYWALQACLPRSFVGCFFFFPHCGILPLPVHNGGIISPEHPRMRTEGKETSAGACKPYSLLKNIMLSSRWEKKTKSICHQMHRVMINKVGPN